MSLNFMPVSCIFICLIYLKGVIITKAKSLVIDPTFEMCFSHWKSNNKQMKMETKVTKNNTGISRKKIQKNKIYDQ